MALVSRKERKEIEDFVRTQYQNVLEVKIEQHPTNSSKLILKVIRGVELPPIEFDRKER